MDLKEYLQKVGRLPKDEVLEASGDTSSATQTVGDFFDLLRSSGYKHLPSNVSVNAGKWIGNNHN